MLVCQPLSASLAASLADDLGRLDDAIVAEFGDAFARTAWSAANFLYDLPGKWSLSQVATDRTGRVTGYWIASRPGGGAVAHAHRVAVHADHRGGGLGRRLAETALEAARSAELAAYTLAVAAGNSAAIAFYQRLGFSLLDGRDAADFAAAHGWTADGLLLVSPTGDCLHGMTLSL